MRFTDKVTISGTRRTVDGYLVAEARCVRTGIQIYGGREMGVADKATVRVYRPPEEVFAADSLQSFTHAPVTLDHPSDPVTADNWRKLAVGEVSTAAKQDGAWVILPLILKDAAAIAAVESGKRELSAGYECQVDWTSGIAPDGQTYDAIQRSIRINHLAIVNTARAGHDARIGDEQMKARDQAVADYANRRGVTDAQAAYEMRLNNAWKLPAHTPALDQAAPQPHFGGAAPVAPTPTADHGQAAYEARLRSAWQGTAA